MIPGSMGTLGLLHTILQGAGLQDPTAVPSTPDLPAPGVAPSTSMLGVPGMLPPSVGSPGTDPSADLRAQLTQMLAPKPMRADVLGPLNVPWSNTPRPSAASYLLRGLVSGWNSRANAGMQGRQQQANLLTLLRLNQQNEQFGQRQGLAERQFGLRQQDVTADNMRADAAQKEKFLMDEWRQTHDDSTLAEAIRYHNLAYGVQSKNAATAAGNLAERIREDRVRDASRAAGGAGGVRTGDISTKVSEYYRAIGARLKKDPQLSDEDRAAVDQWVQKQVETANLNEAQRRQNLGVGAAAPAPAKPSPTNPLGLPE